MFGHEAPETKASRQDFYEILNVPCGASKTLIRESYIRLKSAFSSQNNAFYSLISETEAQQMQMSIEEAFRVLNDDMKRTAYNKEIGVETGDDTGLSIAAFAGSGTESDLYSGDQSNFEFERPAKPAVKTGATTAAVAEGIREKMEALIETEQEQGDGELYKKLRELAGVSDDEMQERTKICIQYIRAIESNNFSELPQTVFVKGFLRSYLKYLSVPNSDTLVRAFAARHENWTKAKDNY